MNITVLVEWYYMDSYVFHHAHDSTWCNLKCWATYDSRTTHRLTICKYWSAIYTFIANPYHAELFDQLWDGVYCWNPAYWKTRLSWMSSTAVIEPGCLSSHSIYSVVEEYSGFSGRVVNTYDGLDEGLSYVITIGIRWFKHSLLAFFVAKPSSRAILTCCQLNLWE